MVVVAVRMMTPHTAELGRLPGTSAKGPVRDVLMRAGTYQRLGDRVHDQVHDAVVAASGTPATRHQPTPPGVPTEDGLPARTETRS